MLICGDAVMVVVLVVGGDAVMVVVLVVVVSSGQ